MRKSSKEIQGLEEALIQNSEATTCSALMAQVRPSPAQPVLHSVMVASKDVNDTNVMRKIKTEMKTKDDRSRRI